jgi:hypothetical protein
MVPGYRGSQAVPDHAVASTLLIVSGIASNWLIGKDGLATMWLRTCTFWAGSELPCIVGS